MLSALPADLARPGWLSYYLATSIFMPNMPVQPTPAESVQY